MPLGQQAIGTMKGFVKTLVDSLVLIFVVSVLAVVYGFVTNGALTFAYVFNANFLVGAVIICIGLVMLFLPASSRFDKLTDHTTFVERYYWERYRPRQKKAYRFLFLGILVILVAGIVQLLLTLAIS